MESNKQVTSFSKLEQTRNRISVVWIRAGNRNGCGMAIQSAVDRESRGAKRGKLDCGTRSSSSSSRERTRRLFVATNGYTEVEKRAVLALIDRILIICNFTDGEYNYNTSKGSCRLRVAGFAP